MQIAPDGLIRLSIAELLALPLHHLMSMPDVDAVGSPSDCGRLTTISGFTEWATATERVISIGWDWRLDAQFGVVRWRRISLPRTNVLLTDARGEDPSWSVSLARLCTVVDSLPWLPQVAGALSIPEGAFY